MRTLVLFVFFVINYFSSFGEEKYRYLVLFKDKNNSPFSLNKPEAFLTRKALDRRAKNQIVINQQDLPVSPAYLNEIAALGATVLYPLKWINGALVKMTPSVKNQVLLNQNVVGLYYPFALDSTIANIPTRLSQSVNSQKEQTSVYDYGQSNTQIVQLGLDHMHSAGITGNQVLITVLDDGFFRTPTLPVFKNLIDESRLVGTLTTSPDRKTVFEKGNHGTNVLSVMVGLYETMLIGGAFNATIALAQTEEFESEKLVEEVNWLRGAEWADSLGTDIIQSSLGYTEFDLPFYNHKYDQMDGNTTLVTKAANWATERGIICVISAGNEGSSPWKFISAPADAKDILSVGAVSSNLSKLSFSSFGPTYDSRIKPDLSALGSGVRAADVDGSYGFYTGTSFSAPLVASLVAGLIEQFPKTPAATLRNILRKSASQGTSPNNNLGYGIPSYEKAVQMLRLVLSTQEPTDPTISIFPNPIEMGGTVRLSSNQSADYEVEIWNIQGQIVNQFTWKGEEKNISLGPIRSGKYFFRIKSASLLKIVPIIVY